MFCAAQIVIVVRSRCLAAAVSTIVANPVASAAKGAPDGGPEALAEGLLPLERREEHRAELEVLEGVDDDVDSRVDGQQEMVDSDQDHNPDWRSAQLAKEDKLKRDSQSLITNLHKPYLESFVKVDDNLG